MIKFTAALFALGLFAVAGQAAAAGTYSEWGDPIFDRMYGE